MTLLFSTCITPPAERGWGVKALTTPTASAVVFLGIGKDIEQ